MTAYTNPDNLPYPDDWQQPADSPSAFRALAEATQVALSNLKTYALNRVTQNWGNNADVAVSQNTLTLWKNAIEAREVTTIGWGLSGGGGTLGNPARLDVDQNVVASRNFVDQRILDLTAVTAPKALDASYNAPPGGVSCAVWPVGSMGPGQELETGIITIPYGAYVFTSVQHPSTYLHVVANLLSPTELQLRIRCSTTQTTLTGVKVHALVVNP